MSDVKSTQPDLIRQIGFDCIYRLPQFEDSGATGAEPIDAQAAMKPFTPEQRDRVFNVAARRLAFQLLYLLDAQAPADSSALVRAELGHVQDLGPLAAEKISSLALGAHAARGQADAEFVSIAPQWPAHRQAGVDRAILRLAHFEITSGLTPARIAINEAVELARHFSTEKSPAFINGLLDKVAQRVGAAAGIARGNEPAAGDA